MKTSIVLISAFVIGTGLFCQDMSARGRQQNTTTTTPTRQAATSNNRTTASRNNQTTVTNRPATTVKPSTATVKPSTSVRPSTSTVKPSATTPSSTQRPGAQPGANGNASTQRPGAQPGANGNASTQRPGSNNAATQRPGTPNTKPNVAPPAANRPNTSPNRPVPPPPPGGYRPNYSYRPPMPHTPPTFHYYRPTPPPNWRPVLTTPNFNTILGVTLGTLLSNSVNALFNSGYHVSGYTNNAVYLRNVPYCDVDWPEATMYYKNGYLEGSVFSASTNYYDPTRYNYVYSNLTARYGFPVASQNLSGGGMSSTWWGVGNSYITLSFYPEYISGVGTRYFTTLSTGN